MTMRTPEFKRSALIAMGLLGLATTDKVSAQISSRDISTIYELNQFHNRSDANIRKLEDILRKMGLVEVTSRNKNFRLSDYQGGESPDNLDIRSFVPSATSNLLDRISNQIGSVNLPYGISKVKVVFTRMTSIFPDALNRIGRESEMSLSFRMDLQYKGSTYSVDGSAGGGNPNLPADLKAVLDLPKLRSDVYSSIERLLLEEQRQGNLTLDKKPTHWNILVSNKTRGTVPNNNPQPPQIKPLQPNQTTPRSTTETQPIGKREQLASDLLSILRNRKIPIESFTLPSVKPGENPNSFQAQLNANNYDAALYLTYKQLSTPGSALPFGGLNEIENRIKTVLARINSR